MGVSSAEAVPRPKYPVAPTVTSAETAASSFFIPTPDPSASLVVSHTSWARANSSWPPVRPSDQRSNGGNRDGADQEGVQQNSDADHETALDDGADAGEQQTAHRGCKHPTRR